MCRINNHYFVNLTTLMNTENVKVTYQICLFNIVNANVTMSLYVKKTCVNVILTFLLWL